MMYTGSTSYWQRTSTGVTLSSHLPQNVDVAVIGGGLLGASTCYWLAREGVQVALLERGAIGDGATGRNGGFVVAGPAESYPDTIAHLGQGAAQAVMSVTFESRDLLRQVVLEEEIACHYREPGTIRLALHEEQIQHLQQEVESLQADGFAAEFLERAQAQTLIKTPLAPDILGGRFLPERGLIHSALFVQGLVSAALRRGAQAYQAEVLALTSEGDHVLLQTSRGTLRAEIVVVAVNAWMGQLLPALADVILPAREQMLAYAPLPPVFTTGVTVDMVNGEYMQQTLDGTIVIGGCSSVASNWDLGVWEMTPTSIVQEAIEQVVPRLFPSLAPLQIVQRWAGLLDCTTDMHPIVDYAPDLANVLFVGGFTGHGMPFGMRFGQLLAATVRGASFPEILKPFRLDRPTLKRWSRLSDVAQMAQNLSSKNTSGTEK